MTARALARPMLLVLSLASRPPAHVAAQTGSDDAPVLAPGARIRVTTASDSPAGRSTTLVGRFAGSEDGELRLDTGAAELHTLCESAIVRLERSLRPSRKTTGAAVGFGVGLAAVLGKAALQGGCNDGCNGGNALAAALVALSTAALGALAAPGESWQDVGLGRGRDGAAATARAAFRVRVVPQLGRRAGLTVVASF